MRCVALSLALRPLVGLILIHPAGQASAQPAPENRIGGFEERFAGDLAIPIFLRQHLTSGYDLFALSRTGVAGAQQRDPADTQVLSELASVKAEMQELKDRVSEVHDSLLQTQDELGQSRSEFSSALGRIETVLGPTSGVASLRFPVNAGANVADVEATGSINQRLTPADEKQLTKADELIGLGDIAGARLLLEYALRPMTAAVAFKLAETYDAEQLAGWRVVGVRSDSNKALELYKQAAAGGIKEAQRRLRGLTH